MKNSKITKQNKNKSILFSILNWLFCFGTFIAYLIYFFATNGGGGDLEAKLGTIIYGFLLSIIPFVLIFILVRNKVKNIIWMGNMILSQYLFGPTALYLTFGLWFLDEYIVAPLSNRYKNKYIINKEIDNRV